MTLFEKSHPVPEADRDALADRKSEYFYALDARDWDHLEALFHPEFTGEIEGESFTSRDQLMTRLKELLPKGQVKSNHMGGNHIYRAIDPDAVQLLTKMYDLLIFDETDPMKPVGIEGYGWYDETWVRVDGQWVMKEMALKRNAYKRLAGGVPPGSPWDVAPAA